MKLIGAALWLTFRFLLCPVFGHDWFNGGEVCRDCDKPRPLGWTPS